MHWAAELQGRPFVAGADGPDSFDCWGLFRYVQINRFGRNVPEVDVERINHAVAVALFKSEEQLGHWRKLADNETPIEGDGILLSHKKEAIHVGIVVKVNGLIGVLHCIKGTGVIYTARNELALSGWHMQRIYRWIR